MVYEALYYRGQTYNTCNRANDSDEKENRLHVGSC